MRIHKGMNIDCKEGVQKGLSYKVISSPYFIRGLKVINAKNIVSGVNVVFTLKELANHKLYDIF